MNTEATTGASPNDSPSADLLTQASHSLMPETWLSLPLLHRESPAALWRTSVPHLWPGLPHTPPDPPQGYWQPEGYPFSPEQSAACLADLDAMSVAALSGVPLQALAAREHRAQTVRELEEQDALRRFAATGEERPSASAALHGDVLLRMAAQKVLLWAWLLEERQREVRDLAHSFDAGAGHLVDALGVEEDDDLAGLHTASMQLGDDRSIMPPWKLVLENAALFLPAHSVIVVNDARMAETVMDQCATFTALSDAQRDRWGLSPLTELAWGEGVFPLWRIAGLTAPSEQRPWLNRSARVVLPVPATTLEAGGDAA